MTKLFLVMIMIFALPILISTSEDKEDMNTEIKRGRELVSDYGCGTCHSPKVETKAGLIADLQKTLSGHRADDKDLPNIPEGFLGGDTWSGVYSKSLTAWAGPWGIAFAANLTPDKETGIGAWSKQNFISTIKLGIHTTSLAREIVPSMPWREFSSLTDDDLGAIYSYLMTLKPITNKVPEHIEPKNY